ncbi:MAG: RNA polymerase sigma factor [Candidatus Eisenbacteria bacterium]
MEDRPKAPEPIDRKLAEVFLRRRDEAAFLELYRRHAPGLRRLATRLVGTRNGDAEDVVQAVWIRAIEGLDGFRWESSLKTWLTGIALNCSREVLRKRKRGEGPEWNDEIHGRPGPSRIHHAIDRIDLENAVGGLPDGYREVLVLHDVEGYTHEEIGRFLGIESGTSKSQLFRARRAVRAKLAERNGDGKP